MLQAEGATEYSTGIREMKLEKVPLLMPMMMEQFCSPVLLVTMPSLSRHP